MKKIVIISLLFMLTCSCHFFNDDLSADMLLAESIINENRSADIFIYGNQVYERVRENNEDLSEFAGEKVGTIQELYQNRNSLRDGMANLLPEGTEIYAYVHDNSCLIVKVNGRWLQYQEVDIE